MDLTIRKARAEESARLAALMNVAGEGIPAYLWAGMAGPGESPMAVGARRLARAEGGFSVANIHVAEWRGEVAGVLLGYRLPDPCEPGSADDLPAVVRPLVELESLVPGSWHVNAIACEAAHRGRGVGGTLMAWAERLAVQSGSERISLIVAEE